MRYYQAHHSHKIRLFAHKNDKISHFDIIKRVQTLICFY